MTALLEDRRLEAAAQMLASGEHEIPHHQVIIDMRLMMRDNPDYGCAILSTAIRETHAAELAEALEQALENLCFGYVARECAEDMDKARAALAAYKEIADG